MKKILSILSVIFAMNMSAQEIDERGYRVRVGEKAPLFDFQLLTGETINNEVLKGKVVVLQFTGSWCSVCRKEMPVLEKEVWQRFKGEDFLLIGLDLKEDELQAKMFAQKMGITYPMASDLEGKLFELFAGPKQGVTRNIVIDKKGEIIFLTRLFEIEEFQEMVKVIELELAK